MEQVTALDLVYHVFYVCALSRLYGIIGMYGITKKVCGNHGVESSQYDDLFCLNWAKDVYPDGTYPHIAGISVDQQLYRLGLFFSLRAQVLEKWPT